MLDNSHLALDDERPKELGLRKAHEPPCRVAVFVAYSADALKGLPALFDRIRRAEGPDISSDGSLETKPYPSMND